MHLTLWVESTCYMKSQIISLISTFIAIRCMKSFKVGICKRRQSCCDSIRNGCASRELFGTSTVSCHFPSQSQGTADKALWHYHLGISRWRLCSWTCMATACHSWMASRQSVAKIGLSVYDGKCELYEPNDLNIQSESVAFLKCGTEILGVPEFVSSNCEVIANSGHDLCCKITELTDSQSALLFVSHCHVPKTNYLSRSICPRYLQSAAKAHDSNIFLGQRSIQDCKCEQATLTVKHGGFGLAKVEER